MLAEESWSVERIEGEKKVETKEGGEEINPR